MSKKSTSPLFISILFTFLLSADFPASAQSWKWAQRHGGDSVEAPVLWAGTLPWQDRYQGWNSVIDIATDPQNNAYVVSNVLSKYLDLNGTPVAGHGKSDILLSSYTCDGALRWTKVIGSNQDSDVVIGVRCDESGVYVSGMTSTNYASGSTGTRFSTDTLTGSSAKNIFLVKWDLAGKFQWLRMPQADNISPQSAGASILMDMDATPGNDTLMLFCYLTPGSYAGGLYTAPAAGAYVLKYTQSGTFAGALRLPFQAPSRYALMLVRWCYNAALRQYIAAGVAFPTTSLTMNISGQVLRNFYGYLANFDAASGALNYLIKDTSTAIASRTISILRKVAVDHKGDIYLSGNAKHGAFFNGVTFLNNIADNTGDPARNGYAPFVMKLGGKTGAPIWTASSQATSAFGLNVCLRKKELLLTGKYRGTLQFPAATISNTPLVDTGDAFMALLDTATGNVRSLSSLRAKKELPLIFNTIVLDRKGSFLCGGAFNDSLTLGATTIVETHPVPFSTGRAKISDAWFGKFGYDNCSCNVAAGFRTFTNYGTTAFVAYNGTPAIDSLVWEWGDGTTTKATNNYLATISHTYAAPGRYQVCVSAYNDTCNDSRYCRPQSVNVANTINEGSIRIYPNPASSDIFIEGLEAGAVRVLSATGQVVFEGAVTPTKRDLQVGHLPPGNYLLQLQAGAGAAIYRPFVKK